MAYLNINQNKLLSQILSDPKAAVLMQQEVSSDATRSSLRIARQLNGVMNQSDKMEFSERIVKAIEHIFEHDYIGYLYLIKRHDLIRELFSDKDLFAKQLALIEEMEEEEAHEKQQYLLITEQEKVLTLSKEAFAKAEQEKEHHRKEIVAHINMDIYQHFVAEVQRIHHVFHDKQIDIYSTAYDDRSERMHRAFNLIKDNPNVSANVKTKLSDLLKNYKEECDEIELMPTTHEDGSINYNAVQMKHDAWKRVDEKYAQEFAGLLADNPSIPGFAELLNEELEATQKYRAELAVNEMQRDQDLAAVMPHLMNAQNITIEDFKYHLNEAIVSVEDANVPEEHSVAFAKSLDNLQEYQRALNATNVESEISSLSRKITKELQILRAITKPPPLEVEKYQKLEKGIDLLTKSEKIISSAPEPPSYDSLSNGAVLPTYEESEAMQRSIDEAKRRSMETTRDFRLALSQESCIKELDEENQDLFVEMVSALQVIWSDMKDDDGLSPEVNKMISESEVLCDHLLSAIREGVDVSKFEKLIKNIGILGKNHDDLKLMAEDLQLILNSPGNAPGPRM